MATLALGACSAGKPPGAPPPIPASTAFHQADAECRETAARETENVSPQTQAAKAAIAVYWRCMTAHGYPPPTSATPAPPAP